MPNGENLWLDPIPPALRQRAIDLLNAGNVTGFLCRASNEAGMDLVYLNRNVLCGLGLYERALLHAFTATRTNNYGWPLEALHDLFSLADPQRLREISQPLPGKGPYTLYRGVAGMGRARRIRGMSWTSSLETASWFAMRLPLRNPAVYEITVPEQRVLAYCNERKENEFIILPTEQDKITRALRSKRRSQGAQYRAKSLTLQRWGTLNG